MSIGFVPKTHLVIATITDDQIDSTTNSQKTVDYSHAEIHGGSHYLAKSYAPVAKAGVKEILIVTPNTTKWAHMVVGIEAVTSSIIVELFEGVTTSDDGTLGNARNRNRNVADNNTTIVYEDPTVTGGATAANLIWDGYFGAGRNSGGGGARDNEELPLEQNTKYLIRITEQDIQATNVNWSLDWYEHTNN